MKWWNAIFMLLLWVIPVSAQTPTLTPDNAGAFVPLTTMGNGLVRQVAWSPDAHALAVASTTGVWLYDDLESAPRKLDDVTVWMESIAYRPDGRQLVSGGLDNQIYVWDAVSGENTDVWAGHTGTIIQLAYSADGQWIASGGEESDGTTKLWNAASGKIIFEFTQNIGSVMSLVFSPDGQYLAWVDVPFSDAPMSEIRILNLQTLEVTQLLRADFLYDGRLTFSADSRWLVFSDIYSRGTVWELPSLAVVESATADFEYVIADTTGIFAAVATGENTYALSDYFTGESAKTLASYDHEKFIKGSYAPLDESVATLDRYRDSIHLWQGGTFAKVRSLTDFTPAVQFLAVNAASNRLISLYTRVFDDDMLPFLDVWELPGGKFLGRVPLGEVKIRQVAVNADLTALAIQTQEDLILYESDCLVEACSLGDGEILKGYGQEIIFYGDDLIISSGNGVESVDGQTISRENARALVTHDGMLFYSIGSRVYQWDGEQSQVTLQTPEEISFHQFVAFEDRVALWDYFPAEIYVWEGSDLRYDYELAYQEENLIPELEILDAAFSVDGQLLAVAGGDVMNALGATYRSKINPVIVWNMQNGQEVMRFNAHQNRVSQVMFSPDGTLLISGGLDGTIRVWGVPAMNE